MKSLKTTGFSLFLLSQRGTEVVVKVILACSLVIIGCEFYILHKL